MSKLQPILAELDKHIDSAKWLRMCLQANVCYEESELVEQALVLLRQRVPGSPEWNHKRGLAVTK